MTASAPFQSAEASEARRGFWPALCGLLAITAIGVSGYVLVEGMSFSDALFMTVITLSTVGYSEVQPLSPAGRLFTIGLIVSGGAMAIYLVSQLARAVLALDLRELFARQDMKKRIDELRDHVILCGFGRFGRFVADELVRAGEQLAVIEQDPARQPDLERSGLPYVLGSALGDDVLQLAGIARARAIVVGTGSDADNVFITLSARQLNPRVRIHARGESDAALSRLRLAGADQVVSSYHMGGLRMAMSILRPAVVDFLEISRPLIGEEIDLEEIAVSDGAALAGHSVAEIERTVARLRIVALKRGSAPLLLAPPGDERIAPGDHLVVIGARAGLENLARQCCAA
jgi:voltage-gated potassium channel